MKIPVRSLLAFRKASTAVVAPAVENVTPATLTAEFYEHIRHQVYGDSKKVDKVVVSVVTEAKNRPVLVNRNVSTAFHCFSHINKQYADDVVLVEVTPTVGGAYFGSVNQPLQDQSEIRKISFDSVEHTNLVNEAYWRSCSFVTAAILRDALDADVEFEFPAGSIQNSYFTTTVKGLEGNVFTPDELSTINRFAKTFIRENKPLEVVAVPKSIADENSICGTSLIRIGDSVFSSDGPVIQSTGQIGRFSIFRSKPVGRRGDILVGGVSLPSRQPTSSYSWSLIAKNAIHKFNKPV